MASKWIPRVLKPIFQPPNQRNVLIYGAGSVGAVIGWRLAQSPNVRVSVICRSNYDAVKSRGFQISTVNWGSGSFMPHAVYKDPAEVNEAPFDYVVCANKFTSSTEKSYRGLGAVINKNTTLVSLQNGIDVEAPIRRMFPNNPLISGIIYFSCRQPEPGIISQHARIRPYILGLALFDRRLKVAGNHDEDTFAEFIRLGGGEFQPLRDLLTERWSKQIWNGAFNPMCAIFKLNTHELLRDTNLGIAAVSKVMHETYNVATAAGAIIDPITPQKLIDITMRNPPIEPSMLQDVRLKRAIEVDSLSGNVWRLGAKLGVDVTELKSLYGELRRINKASMNLAK